MSKPPSYPQVLGQQFRVGLNPLGAAFEHHLALDQDDVAVGDAGDVLPVLVDDDAWENDVTDGPDFLTGSASGGRTGSLPEEGPCA